MKRPSFWFVLFVFVLAGVLAFTNQNPFLQITEKDVLVNLPKNFPKPVYRFAGNKPSPEGFTLGRKLFYDEILSKDGTVSCATCHQRIAAFAHIDHALSHGIYAKIGTRNVPALQNLLWNTSFMMDGRVTDLESQPVNPITNAIEMDETMEGVEKKLRSNNEYRQLFARAFGDSMATKDKILKALAQFTGLMISSNSRYDKFMRHEDTLSAMEKNGLTTFRKKCTGCHSEPLLTDNTFRNTGLAPDSSLKDTGRGKITANKNDDFKFRVPGLRNIEITYPYMHDGRFRNLQQVIAFYANGANFGRGADPMLRKIGALSAKEQSELLAFLKTLTDRQFLYDRRFADPRMP